MLGPYLILSYFILFYFILLFLCFYFHWHYLFTCLSINSKFIVMFLILIDFCWAMHSGIQTTLLIFATLPLINVLHVYPSTSIVISFQPHSLSYIRYPISYPISYILYPLSYIMSLSLNGYGVDQSLAERIIRTLLTIFFSYFNP